MLALLFLLLIANSWSFLLVISFLTQVILFIYTLISNCRAMVG
uniref:Uncharacterized protein n=1 Tax=Rhizophora mucronata TaxID=61149 RepID=A0A2P2IHS0_RHIMU